MQKMKKPWTVWKGMIFKQVSGKLKDSRSYLGLVMLLLRLQLMVVTSIFSACKALKVKYTVVMIAMTKLPES